MLTVITVQTGLFFFLLKLGSQEVNKEVVGLFVKCRCQGEIQPKEDASLSSDWQGSDSTGLDLTNSYCRNDNLYEDLYENDV